MANLTSCAGITDTYSCFLYTVSLQQQLLISLQNNYSPSVMPRIGFRGNNAKILVFVQPNIYKLLALTKSKQLSVLLTIFMAWTDPNIAFPVQSDTYNFALINSTYVWTPNFQLTNAATSNGTLLFVDANVAISGTPPLGCAVQATLTDEIDSTCESMNFINFPFDTQTCSMQLTAINGNGYVTYFLTAAGSSISPGASSSEWVITNSSLVSTSAFTYPAFNITLVLQRQSYYYVLNLIIPTIVLNSLNAFVLFLPSENGAKTELSATIMLAVYFLLNSVSQLIPQFQSNQTPYYVIALNAGLYACIATLSESVLLQALHIFAPGFPRKVNRFAIWLFVDLLRQQRCYTHETSSNSKNENIINSLKYLETFTDNLALSGQAGSRRLMRLLVATEKLEQLKARKRLALKEEEATLAENLDIKLAWQRFEYAVNFICLLGFIGLLTYYFGSLILQNQTN